jgi:NADH dehydrogenase
VIGHVHLSGFLAWLTWLLAHIYFLINFRNRVIVMIDWSWSYWTFQRYARIVFGRGSLPGNPEQARQENRHAAAGRP